MDERVVLDARHPEMKLARRLEPGGEIGRGGMAEVIEAFDKNLLRRAAMKVLDRDLARNPAVVRQFIEEAQIQAQLDHPNIIPVHELGEGKRGALFFTMKRVQGKSLHQLIGEQDPVQRDPEDLYALLHVLLKVLDAVAFAHERGILHLDLKPHNVMVGDHGQVYLMDWGLSRPKGGQRLDPDDLDLPRRRGKRYEGSLGDQVCGTLSYMPPEQARAQQAAIDERSDVFSLGAMLYELLCGLPPYLGETVERLRQLAMEGRVVDPQRRTRAALSPWLCRIAMRALATEPADRYQTAADMRADLQRFMHSGWHYPRRQVAAGEFIVREGDPGAEAFILLRGRCRVFRTVDGRDVKLREMGQGEVFGELAVLTGQARAAHVQALDDCELAVITEEVFRQEMGMGYWMGRFMQVLAERFRELDGQLTGVRRELEAERLAGHAVRWLIRSGKAEQGLLSGSWSSLASELGAVHDRGPDEIASLLEARGGFRIDRAGDSISLLQD